MGFSLWAKLLIALGVLVGLAGLLGSGFVLLAEGRPPAPWGYAEHVDPKEASAKQGAANLAALERWGLLLDALRSRLAAPKRSRKHFHHARYTVGPNVLTAVQPYATPDLDRKHDYSHRWEGTEYERAATPSPPPRSLQPASAVRSAQQDAVAVPLHSLAAVTQEQEEVGSTPRELEDWSVEELASFVSSVGSAAGNQSRFGAYSRQIVEDRFTGCMVLEYESLEVALDDWGVEVVSHRDALTRALAPYLRGDVTTEAAVQVHVNEDVHMGDLGVAVVPNMGDDGVLLASPGPMRSTAQDSIPSSADIDNNSGVVVQEIEEAENEENEEEEGEEVGGKEGGKEGGERREEGEEEGSFSDAKLPTEQGIQDAGAASQLGTNDPLLGAFRSGSVFMLGD